MEVTPFTYEQLWKVTGIHRNILRKKLDDLVGDSLVGTYRFRIPFGTQFRGYICHDGQQAKGFKYYMLNLIEPESQTQIATIMGLYYNKSSRQRFGPKSLVDLKTLGKEKKKLSNWEDRIQFYYDWRLDELELVRHRATDFLSEENRKLIESDNSLRYELLRFAQFILKNGYSLLDFVIRVCSMPTVFQRIKSQKGPDFVLPIIRYSNLINILLKTDFKPNLEYNWRLANK